MLQKTKSRYRHNPILPIGEFFTNSMAVIRSIIQNHHDRICPCQIFSLPDSPFFTPGSIDHTFPICHKKPCPMKKQISMDAPERLHLGLTTIISPFPVNQQNNPKYTNAGTGHHKTDARTGISHALFIFAPSSIPAPIDRILFQKNVTVLLVWLTKLVWRFQSPYGDFGNVTSLAPYINLARVLRVSVPLRGFW